MARSTQCHMKEGCECGSTVANVNHPLQVCHVSLLMSEVSTQYYETFAVREDFLSILAAFIVCLNYPGPELKKARFRFTPSKPLGLLAGLNIGMGDPGRTDCGNSVCSTIP